MRELDERERDDQYARLWQPEDDRILFVTHLTPESGTRYQFELTDPDTGQCLYAKGAGTTPPRLAVEILNDNGYEVQNLPNVTDTDPAVRAHQIADAIDWLGKHGGLETEGHSQFAYQRAQNVMPVIYFSVLLMDAVGPDTYTKHLEETLADANIHGRAITKDELLDTDTHDIEFLQTLILEVRKSLPMELQEALVEQSEDRLGITGDPDSESPEAAETWESTTQGEETIQLSETAWQTLQEEGWMPDSEEWSPS